MTEKEILLAAASPQEWDCWLTKTAEDYASMRNEICIENQDCDKCPWESTCDLPCLFCLAFDDNCRACMGGSKIVACRKISDFSKVDAAIARLERAGIWGDEE